MSFSSVIKIVSRDIICLCALYIKRENSGYKKISLHMVFDVKMDFTRKARLVAEGHLSEVPQYLTYSSVLSRETVCIIFLIAVLNNDLDILSIDIGNAYLNAPNREKV